MASSDTGNRPVAAETWTSGNQNTLGPSVLPVIPGPTWPPPTTVTGTALRQRRPGGEPAADDRLTTSTGTLQIGGDAYSGENFAGPHRRGPDLQPGPQRHEIQTDMNTPVGGTPPPTPRAVGRDLRPDLEPDVHSPTPVR